MRYGHAIGRLSVTVVVLLFALGDTLQRPDLSEAARWTHIAQMGGTILVFGALALWLFSRR